MVFLKAIYYHNRLFIFIVYILNKLKLRSFERLVNKISAVMNHSYVLNETCIKEKIMPKYS